MMLQDPKKEMTEETGKREAPDPEKDLQLHIAGLYRLYFKGVAHYVLQNRGTLEDARDLFQEMLVAYLKILRSGEVVRDERKYLNGMARNMWMNVLNAHARSPIDHHATETLPATAVLEDPQVPSLADLVVRKMEEIGEDCRKLLFEGFYMRRTNGELAQLMGYTEQFVKVKKHRCLQGLKRLVERSPEYLAWKLDT
jgi:RNA polymerase sigma factor (sigma-70 family)